MKLVIDENIPAARAAFAPFGELVVLPGRRIDAQSLREAEVLLVRSITQVDEQLLAGSRVRFVGTTTAGIDHVDTGWLAANGIRFASAPGSNAASVVDYVLAVLALYCPEGEPSLANGVGIVGCGEVGGRLLRRLRALGISCRVFDPYVEAIAEQDTLDNVLACGVVTLHVPLTTEGRYPTRHMIDAERLARMREDVLLINAARGPVVDNAALGAALAARSGIRAVLDTWEPEPALDPRLLARCLLGTPHIAGHAVDAKLRGAVQVYEALRDFLGSGRPAGEVEGLRLPSAGTLGAQLRDWRSAVLACYDPRADDARLRAETVGDPASIAQAFDRLRRDYPPRREFGSWQLGEGTDAAAELRAAGFGAQACE